jgi:hypothetical protein
METTALLEAVIESGEDFEWYPTTQRMINVVAKRIGNDSGSLMDIGAGDGRVLMALGKWRNDRGDEGGRQLFSIEKSAVLAQAQPEGITPVGTDFYEQNLACLPVDYIFCNPPYSQFESWAATIIESGFAKTAFLVIPRRWKESQAIAAALKKRKAKARVIHSDDFEDAERRARAVVDIVEVSFPTQGYREEPTDPFDIWFDQNIDTFDRADEEDVPEYEQAAREMAKIRHLNTIGEMVDGYNEEYARMEENYRAIFKLDYALLAELGVKKDGVRDGIKKRMAGLKSKYWTLLFERLDTITNRLSTATKKKFLEKIAGRRSIAFTASNAYTIVLWAIKNANRYFDEQCVKLFRDLSTHDGVLNYKSNQRTWQRDQWRYRNQGEDLNTHYALDYRIVVEGHSAIATADKWGHVSTYDNPGNLARSCHELIDDITAVFYNLGFPVSDVPSRNRWWESNQWEDWTNSQGEIVFQVKGFKNGNLHFRFKPDAIKALNVEAGRLLGWLRGPEDVVTELGYTPEEASAYFGSNRRIGASNLKLLAAC